MDFTGTYFQLLPRDLKDMMHSIDLINSPYPQMIPLCDKSCKNETFWLEKAAFETNQVTSNQESDFFRFFNMLQQPILYKYIRSIAYDGKCVAGIPSLDPRRRFSNVIPPSLQSMLDKVKKIYSLNFIFPGSDIILQPEEMFRHAAKGDQYLMDYCFYRFYGQMDDENIALIIFICLALNLRLQNILEYCTLMKTPQLYHSVPMDPLSQIIMMLIPRQQFDQFMDRLLQIPNITEKLYVYNFLEDKMILYDNIKTSFVGEPLYQKVFLLRNYGPSHPSYKVGEYKVARIVIAIIENNIENLKKEGEFSVKNSDIPLIVQLISHYDNLQVFKIVAPSLFNSWTIQNVTNLFFKYSTYGSNIFEDLIKWYINYPYPIDPTILAYKLRTDFAGLVILYKQIKDKASFWNALQGDHNTNAYQELKRTFG